MMEDPYNHPSHKHETVEWSVSILRQKNHHVKDATTILLDV